MIPTASATASSKSDPWADARLQDGPRTGCSGRVWALPQADSAAIAQFAQTAAVPDYIARLLWARGIRTAAESALFFAPDLRQMHDPDLLCGMHVAVGRIIRAVRSGETILVYGDYDVDGTLATVLLKTAIDRITPKSRASLVRYHIPHRIREGYGVQANVLGEAAAQGVRLVISVDTGIRAFAAADEAAALGLDLIVTDHHLPEATGVPRAVAVINPNQAACKYPEKHLCGAAVAWKLAVALLRAAKPGEADLNPVAPASLEKLELSLLKLAAIATVADAVPLTGENRAIVALGLAELREVRQPGLRALMHLANVGQDGRAPTATEIGFRIAPRINAAGRMDFASDVVQLLLTRDTVEAEALAARLHSLNDDRRTVEAEVLLEIHAQIDQLTTEQEASAPGVFVLEGDGWHRGVIGILASRVVDRTGRPALVITHDGGIAHGSGRSVDGFHLLQAITAAHEQHAAEQAEDLFLRFGGHAHAVGFSLPSERVAGLRRRMRSMAVDLAHAVAAHATLQADAELPLHLAGQDTWEWLCRMQPFGNGNEEPVFVATRLRIEEARSLKERHLKLRLQPEAGPVVECLCWARSFDWPQRLMECGIGVGTFIDLLYQVRWNERPAFRGLEIHVCDLRSSVAP